MKNTIGQVILNINIYKAIVIFLLLLILYTFIMGVLIFARPGKIANNNSYLSPPDFYSDKVGPDRGILLDNPLDSGIARLKIIGDAQETLDISYFCIKDGESPNLFFGALIEAADRGVQVNLLLDGLFHGIKGEFKPIMYTFMLHPNMKLKFYEPFNPFMPWTFNNRMHDKYIIADNRRKKYWRHLFCSRMV